MTATASHPPGPQEPPVLRPGPDGKIGVVAAWHKVLAGMPAIERTREQGSGVQYAFRGIERIAAEARVLMAEHGLVPMPSCEVLDRQHSPNMGDAWTDVLMRVTWTILHVDGSSLTAVTYGLGRDNSDKGTNKATTQAFKYLLVPSLMITDEREDADRIDTSAGEATAMSADTAKAAMRDRATMLAEQAGLVGPQQADYVKSLCTLAWRTIHAGAQQQLTSFAPATMTAVMGVINTLHANEYPEQP